LISAGSPVERLRCRALAARCLREIGPDAGEVVPALVQILGSSEDPLWRARAALSFGGMGLQAVQAIPALIAATEDANEELSQSAFGALRELRALACFGGLVGRRASNLR
jgi:HEAT repeat protein